MPIRPTPAWVLHVLGRIGQWLAIVTGKPPTLTPETVGMVTRRMFCDCAKAERALGYKPVDLCTMVGDSYRWLEKKGLLAA